MKSFRIVSILAAGLAAVAWTGPRLVAAEPTDAPAAPTPSGELRNVERFLHLSDAELDEIARVIQRIRAMTPGERAAMRREIEAFRKLPEPERRQWRQGWGQMPRDVQDDWREMMQAATSERRAEIHEKLQVLSPEAKIEYRRELVEAYRRAKLTEKPDATTSTGK